MRDNKKITNVGSLKFLLKDLPDEMPINLYAVYLPLERASEGVIQKAMRNLEVDVEDTESFSVYGDITNPSSRDEEK